MTTINKKNKVNIVRTIITVLTIIILLTLTAKACYLQNHYTKEGVVVAIENEIVVVEDKIGYEWAFEGEGYKKGDKVRLLMFTNNTDNTIEDDIIEEVKLY